MLAAMAIIGGALHFGCLAAQDALSEQRIDLFGGEGIDDGIHLNHNRGSRNIMRDGMTATSADGPRNDGATNAQAILLIILPTPDGITQQLVGGAQFDEASSGIWFGAGVRVVAFHLASIGRFDLLFTCAGRDAKKLVIVDKSHRDPLRRYALISHPAVVARLRQGGAIIAPDEVNETLCMYDAIDYTSIERIVKEKNRAERVSSALVVSTRYVRADKKTG